MSEYAWSTPTARVAARRGHSELVRDGRAVAVVEKSGKTWTYMVVRPDGSTIEGGKPIQDGGFGMVRTRALALDLARHAWDDEALTDKARNDLDASRYVG